jgi:hypothetical protein
MSTYATSTFFVAVLVYNLVLMIWLGSREHSARSFAVGIGFIATWVLCAAFAYSFVGLKTTETFFAVKNFEIAALFVRGCYFFGTLIGITMFYFALTYPNNYKPEPYVRGIFVFTGFLVAFLYFAKDIAFFFGSNVITEQTIITDVYINSNGYLGWHFGKGIVFFYLFFFSFWSAALATVWQKYKNQVDTVLRKQTLFMFWAIASGIIPGSMFNSVLPGAGIFGFFWAGLMATFGWVGIIAYSILKQNQMNVKMVTAELLIVGMILLMFIGFFAV